VLLFCYLLAEAGLHIKIYYAYSGFVTKSARFFTLNQVKKTFEFYREIKPLGIELKYKDWKGVVT